MASGGSPACMATSRRFRVATRFVPGSEAGAATINGSEGGASCDAELSKTLGDSTRRAERGENLLTFDIQLSVRNKCTPVGTWPQGVLRVARSKMAAISLA